MDELQRALAGLDPDNDSHWTNDGLPFVNYIKTVTGNPDLGRVDITEADPTLTRQRLLDEREQREGGESDTELSSESEETPSRESLEAEMQTLSKEIADLQKQERTFAEQREEKEQALFARQREYEQVLREESGGNELHDLIAAKQRRDEVQAARRQQLLATGIDIQGLAAELDNKAPIDRALNQRRPTPGTERPSVPVNVGEGQPV